MPKIRREEEVEEEVEDEDEDDEEDELEQKPAPLEKKRRKKAAPAAPEEPKRRYGVIPPQPVRLIDTESEEVIGEGDYLVTTALADILERLERIETSIGSMLEG